MKQQTKSTLLVAFSMMVFGTVGVFRRYVPLDSALLACVRGVLGCVFLAAFMLLRGQRLLKGISKKDMGLLVLSGALIGFNWMLLFEAYNYISVAAATLCYYMQPTIVIILCAVWYKEHLSPKQAVCAAVSVIGMVFVSGICEGGLASVNVPGVACGLGAAFMYAAVVLINKKIRCEDAYQKTFVQLGTAALALMPYLALTGTEISFAALTPASLTALLVLGIVHTGICYSLYFGGMTHIPTRSVAILGYIDPVLALILSWTVLGDPVTLFGVLGAVLIIGAALVSELKKNEKSINNGSGL